MTGTHPTVEILGVPIAMLSAGDALDLVERLHDDPSPQLVAYANAHTLNLATGDPRYSAVLGRAGIVLNDGSGVGLAARLTGRRFPENLNGSDFNPRIVELAARKGWPLYLLGSDKGVAEEAGEKLTARFPGLRVAGTHHGYFERSRNREVAAAIEKSGASIVMVAMGNPLQEMWLDEMLPATGARLGVGVGAFFDFTVGRVRRAPAWMNRAGIEWVYRLGQEPARMWRRYVVGNPVFLARVIRARTNRKKHVRG